MLRKLYNKIFNPMADADPESEYPHMSLTKWGDSALKKADVNFYIAQGLMAKARYEGALHYFVQCLEVVAKKKSSIGVRPFLKIYELLAMCSARVNGYPRGIGLLLAHEQVLFQAQGWEESLHPGMSLQASEVPRNELLIDNYLQRGEILKRADQYGEAADVLAGAAEFAIEHGLLDRALECCRALEKVASWKKRNHPDILARASALRTEVVRNEGRTPDPGMVMIPGEAGVMPSRAQVAPELPEEFVGKDLAEIDTESGFPNVSLTIEGRPVLRTVDEKFKEGQRCLSENRFAEGARAYEACIAATIAEETPLYIKQYLMILLHLGHCFRDLGDFPRALEQYDAREILIRQEENWHRVLPDGLHLLVTSFNQEEMLGVNFQSKGLAYQAADDFESAVEHYALAARLAAKVGFADFAEENCRRISRYAFERKDWNKLKFSGELMRELLGPEITDEQEEHALASLEMAAVKQSDFPGALELCDQRIALLRKMNSPDLQSALDTRENIARLLEM